MSTPKKTAASLDASTATTPKRQCRQSFWRSKQPKLEQASDTVVNIEDLSTGSNSQDTLRFLLTFLTRGTAGKNLYLRAADKTGEIVIRAFQSEKKLCPVFQVGKVYTMQGFNVDDKYGKQIVLNSTSKIQPVDGNPDNIEMPFNKVELREVSSKTKGSKIDIVGYVCLLDDENRENWKQIVITDDAMDEIYVNFWNEDANLEFKAGDMLMLRHVKVGSKYEKGMSVNVDFLTDVLVNPERKEATELKEKVEAAIVLDEDASN